VAQGLEVTRSTGLFNENVTSFYDKLEKLYKLHNYDSSYIWNCDELGVQGGRGGQGNYWPKMDLTMFIQLHWKNGKGYYSRMHQCQGSKYSQLLHFQGQKDVKKLHCALGEWCHKAMQPKA
jgi:hypothetical protein